MNISTAIFKDITALRHQSRISASVISFMNGHFR